MSQRSLRSSGRKSMTPANVASSSDSSDSEDEERHTRSSRRPHTAARGPKSRGKAKIRDRKPLLIDFDPPPTPGSHPSEEDDDMEATPMFVSPYMDFDNPPPTPGFSGGFDTVRLGAPVPSLVPSSISAMLSNTGMNIDQPPPTPCPIIHVEDDGRRTPPIGSMNPPPTPRMGTPVVLLENMTSSTSLRPSSNNYPYTSKGRGKNKGGKSRKVDYRAGVTCSVDEMVQNSILYFLLMQQRKIPVKRAEVIKHAMNGQYKDFKPVMASLSAVFDDVFGISLVGLEDPKGAKTTQSQNYVLVSKYFMSLSDSVTYRPPEVHYKRTILFLILTCAFMMNRSVEEDVIWKMITDLQLHNDVGLKRAEDLRRYLKSEYVTPMYLASEESKEAEPEVNTFRYSWGLRSHKEFSKYSILKFVTKQFPGKKVSDYSIQYGIVSKEETAAVDKDKAAAAAARVEAGQEVLEDDVPDIVLPEGRDPLLDDEDDDDDDDEFLSAFGLDKGKRTEKKETRAPLRSKTSGLKDLLSPLNNRDNYDDDAGSNNANDGSDMDERMQLGTDTEEIVVDENPPSPVL